MKTKVDESTNFEGGKNRITLAGKYHLICVGPEDGVEQDDHAKMEFKVIGAGDGSQIDKTIEHSVDFDVRYPSDDSAKLQKQQNMVFVGLAHATSALAMTEMVRGRVATMDEWRQWKGQEVEFNFEQALGRQIVAEIEIDEFDLKDKDTGQPTGEKGHVPRINKTWTILSPVDPDAVKKGYPLNPQHVEMLGGAAPTPATQTTVTQATQPAEHQAAPQQEQTASPSTPAAAETPAQPASDAGDASDDPWAAFA